jgi:hypothetical protein
MTAKKYSPARHFFSACAAGILIIWLISVGFNPEGVLHTSPAQRAGLGRQKYSLSPARATHM